MSFEVEISPSGHKFSVPDGKTVLTAAFEAGVKLPNGCRMGTCRTCRGRVIEGTVDHGLSHLGYLTQEMRDEGYALLCQAQPMTDLVVEVEELPFLATPQEYPTYVKSMEKLSDDVMKLQLRLPLHANMTFTAGQYVDILLPDSHRRAYSIANAPASTGVITVELHLRLHPGGYFTPRVFNEMKTREMLQIEGPLGSFFLRESHKPALLLATGTGYAPIRSMILDSLAWRPERELVLYWGARQREDLYLLEEVEALAAQHDALSVIPVLSRGGSEWTGRSGHVQDVALADWADVSGVQVYACGSPQMVADAEKAFAARDLPSGEFFADAFVTEAELRQSTKSL